MGRLPNTPQPNRQDGTTFMSQLVTSCDSDALQVLQSPRLSLGQETHVGGRLLVTAHGVVWLWPGAHLQDSGGGWCGGVDVEGILDGRQDGQLQEGRQGGGPDQKWQGVKVPAVELREWTRQRHAGRNTRGLVNQGVKPERDALRAYGMV